ncbi:site-2 protease family protein [Carboxydothermus hydrogenoformans]|uniref:Peptidase, M50 family n=1 Tax=Carboxydothermus hydrogenoformans (strain ATCC BAA-161 / DSM 6008 / Z-2901) TaxID=246194 RepID=Q3AAR7_CARHZ|nr:site-2 protease family protein [Carboxydothermus hydrogenoformans]ABB14210.1 peptidase, M50 family [Carboxydothermus hydrogenoformans Z-2901]
MDSFFGFLRIPSLYDLGVMLPGIIVGLTIHEFSHALVATSLGDDTPRREGRLTLSPLSHIDPVGVLLLLIAGFGWAKPVPVNPYNFRGDPRNGMALVALAGPLSNFVLAFIIVLFLAFGGINLPYAWEIGITAVAINVSLGVFNLLPVFPLDGEKIFNRFFSYEIRKFMVSYGQAILLLLLFTGAISFVLQPITRFILNFYFALFKFLVG